MSRIFENISLKARNSFSVDVSAKKLIEFESSDELQQILAENRDLLQGQWYLLGGGNNTLFTRNFEGTILHPVSRDIIIKDENDYFVSVKADAGVDWDKLVEWCVDKGLWGLENLSLIPGQAGAAPVQNIGAYGCEVKDSIISVEMIDTDTLKKITLANEHCAFGYRNSVFKNFLKGKVIITSVLFRLSKSPQPNLKYGALQEEVKKLGEACLYNIRQAVINIRQSKLPDPKITGNAGSFFKNPIVDTEIAENLRTLYPTIPIYKTEQDNKSKLAAGWLIEQAGWKGVTLGNAGVHDKQALVLVNRTGHATGKEIIALAEQIVKSVKNKFGVEISPEVNIL